MGVIMTDPRKYLFRMLIFIFIVSAIVVVLNKPLIGAFQANIAINGLILSVLFIVSIIAIFKWNTGHWLQLSIVERLQSLVGASSSETIASANVQERFEIWKQTLLMIKNNWTVGVGSGNWKIVAPEYLSNVNSLAKGEYFLLRPHNSWLQIAAELGIFGWFLFVGFWMFA